MILITCEEDVFKNVSVYSCTSNLISLLKSNEVTVTRPNKYVIKRWAC